MQFLRSTKRHQLDLLASTPSNWRILNLNLQTTSLTETQSDRAGGFFQSRGLNHAVLLKHSVREHEEALFDTAPAVATKLLIPLDGRSMNGGALSVMVGERSYRETLRRWLGLKMERGLDASKPSSDALILAQLDAMPSFDPLLLSDAFADGLYGVSEDYIRHSLTDDTAMRNYLVAELAPLVVMAGGNPGRVPRFIDAMFGARPENSAIEFLAKMGIPESRRTPTIAAWKAAMRFEAGLPKLLQRMSVNMRVLEATPLYGMGDIALGEARDERERMLDSMLGLVEEMKTAAELFGHERRKQIAREKLNDLGVFLAELPGAVAQFLPTQSVAEHIISHCEMSLRSIGRSSMPTTTLHRIAQELNRIAEGVRLAFHRQPLLYAA